MLMSFYVQIERDRERDRNADEFLCTNRERGGRERESEMVGRKGGAMESFGPKICGNQFFITKKTNMLFNKL